MPRRIQRKRTKGWRMPPGAVYVGRPSIWGNPWRADDSMTADECVRRYREWLRGEFPTVCPRRRARILRDLHRLRGVDLACWCPVDQACHADVLLRMANGSRWKYLIAIVVQYDEKNRLRPRVIMDGGEPHLFCSVEEIEGYREGHEWHNRVWWAVDLESGRMWEVLPF